jgi:hypothetical protein
MASINTSVKDLKDGIVRCDFIVGKEESRIKDAEDAINRANGMKAFLQELLKAKEELNHDR